MLRRYFLLRVLLGYLLSIGAKTQIFNHYKLSSILDYNLIDSQAEPILFFVATNGNDSWSGKQANPSKNNKDGPFATWKKAQEAVQAIKKNYGLNQPVKVIFSAGTYYLTEPIVFAPDDSGTKSFPISYEAKPQQQVTISGGKVIKNWQETQLGGLRLWTANLPLSLKETNFQHLWVNGQRRTRARYPNKGYLKVKSVFDRQGQNWYDGDRKFGYKNKDLPTDIELQGSEAIVLNRWVESRLRVTKVDPKTSTLHFDRESVFKLKPDDLYYLENKIEFLDTPGEWYLDSQESRLYYLPLPQEAIASSEIIAPALDTLMLLLGDVDKDIAVSHLRFNNLTFAHTDWHLPSSRSGYNQNAWGVNSAVVANGIKDCHWHYCTWKHLGGYGIELFRRCQHNQIVRCSFFDLGGGGIKIGERKIYHPKVPEGQASHHNLITHNHIYQGGKFFPSAVGIGVASSHHNSISYNHVHDLYYTGISIIGDWGFELTQAHNNLIEHNYVHHIGKLSNQARPLLSDMGGIYTVGNQPETIIRHNRVHDIYGVRYGGWGIYLDEGSSKILVENNLVYNTSHGGFSQHYGRENLIRNNVFAFGKKNQIHRNKKDLKTARKGNFISFYFKNNIVYWEEGKFITGLKEDYQSNVVFENNIYWHTGNSPIAFGSLNWEEWQTSDRLSQLTDPLFVAPHQGNFKLKSNSPYFN